MAALIRCFAAALVFGISGAASATSASNGVAFALLAENRLLVVDPGGVLAARTLGALPQQPATGRRLALSRDGALVYALIVGTRGSSIVALDARTGRVSSRYSLPRKAIYQALVVGSRSGRLYAFGNRTTRRETPIVSILARTGKLRSTLAFRTITGYWPMYDGAVSADERMVYASYHGLRDGIDWLRLGPKVTHCRARSGAVGCLRAHGAIAPLGRNLFIATGSPGIWKIDLRGRVLARLNTRLGGNHLMQFALDPERQEVDAIGSCGYAGGLSRVSLEGGSAVVFRHGVCGERVALGEWPLAVVAKTARPVPQMDQAGEVLFVNRSTGEVTATVPTPSEPIDVIVAS
jgi:hypothetical protein